MNIMFTILNKYKFIILCTVVIIGAGLYVSNLHTQIDNLTVNNNNLIIEGSIKDTSITLLNDSITKQNTAINQLHNDYTEKNNTIFTLLEQTQLLLKQRTKQYDVLINQISNDVKFDTCEKAINNSLKIVIQNPWRQTK